MKDNSEDIVEQNDIFTSSLPLTKRRVFKLSFLSLFLQFTISMVNFSLVYLFSSRGFSSVEIGLSASVNPTIYFFSCILFSYLKIPLKEKNKIIVGLILMFSSILGIFFIPSKTLSFLFLIINGFSQSLLWPNIEELISHNLEGKELSSALSSFNLSWSFGSGLSTYIGGFLATKSYSLPLSISLILFSLLIFYSLFFLTNSNKENKEKTAEKTKETKLRYFSWIGLFWIYVGYGALITIFPLYASKNLHFSELTVGTLLLLRGLSAFLVFLSFKLGLKISYNVITLIVIRLSFVLLFRWISVSSSPLVLGVLFFLFGIDFGFSYDTSIYTSALGKEEERGKRMFIHEASLTLGSLIGNTFGGFVFEHFSFSFLLEVIALLSFVSLLLEFPFIFKSALFSDIIKKRLKNENGKNFN